MKRIAGAFGVALVSMVVVIAMTQVSSLTQTEWCSANANNTNCKLTGPKRGVVITRNKITTLQKLLLMYKINSVRSNTSLGTQTGGKPGPQPGATNMNFTNWDNDLAQCAQLWTDQCNVTSNPYYCYTNSSMDSGQIYWAVSTPLSNLNDASNIVNMGCGPAVDAWANQVVNYDMGNVAKSPANFTVSGGPYAQMVQASSTIFGCGWTQCTKTGSTTVTSMCTCYFGKPDKTPLPVYTQAATTDDTCSYCTTICEDGLCQY